MYNIQLFISLSLIIRILFNYLFIGGFLSFNMESENTAVNARTVLDGSVRVIIEDACNLSDLQIADLNKITARCFGKDVPLQETIEHVREAHLLTLLMVNEGIRGYGLNSRLVLNGTNVNYFGSGFIDPDLHNHNLYALLNNRRDLTMETDTIMTRTQNPKVYSAFRKLCLNTGRNVSPCFDGRIDGASLSLARAFFPECTDKQVCNGVYGRELMAETPRPDELTRFIMGKLDKSAGDAVILVGRRV